MLNISETNSFYYWRKWVSIRWEVIKKKERWFILKKCKGNFGRKLQVIEKFKVAN